MRKRWPSSSFRQVAWPSPPMAATTLQWSVAQDADRDAPPIGGGSGQTPLLAAVIIRRSAGGRRAIHSNEERCR